MREMREEGSLLSFFKKKREVSCMCEKRKRVKKTTRAARLCETPAAFFCFPTHHFSPLHRQTPLSRGFPYQQLVHTLQKKQKDTVSKEEKKVVFDVSSREGGGASKSRANAISPSSVATDIFEMNLPAPTPPSENSLGHDGLAGLDAVLALLAAASSTISALLPLRSTMPNSG